MKRNFRKVDFVNGVKTHFKRIGLLLLTSLFIGTSGANSSIPSMRSIRS